MGGKESPPTALKSFPTSRKCLGSIPAKHARAGRALHRVGCNLTPGRVCASHQMCNTLAASRIFRRIQSCLFNIPGKSFSGFLAGANQNLPPTTASSCLTINVRVPIPKTAMGSPRRVPGGWALNDRVALPTFCLFSHFGRGFWWGYGVAPVSGGSAGTPQNRKARRCECTEKRYNVSSSPAGIWETGYSGETLQVYVLAKISSIEL